MASGWKALYYGFSRVVQEFSGVQTDTVLVPAPGVGKYIEVAYIEFSCNAAGKFYLKSDGTTAVACTKYFPVTSGVAIDEAGYQCLNNEALTFTSNIAGDHSIMVYYYIRQS